MSKWKRVKKPRQTENRVNVYYYSPGDNVRKRSINDVKKYFEEKGLNFDQEKFSFKPTGSSGNVQGSKSKEKDEKNSRVDPDEIEKANKEEVLLVDVPRTYEESQLSHERGHWKRAMCEENVMKSRKVLLLVDLPPGCRVIGSKWVYTVKEI